MRLTSYTHDGLVFDVADTGPLDGEVVVLLHGFPQTSTSWAAVAEGLHARGFRTLAPDQRGYSPGARPRGRFAYRMSALVGDTVALLDRIGELDGADRPVHLVGHDWGAAVAWSVAAARPDLVRTLTTVSVPHPAAFLRSMVTSPQAALSWYMAVFQLPALPEWALRRQRLGDRFVRHAGMTPEQAATTRREVIESGALTGALNWYRAMPFSSPSSLGKVTVPTTHLWSDGDVALHRRGAETTRRWVTTDFDLVVLPGVSHWIPEEAPDAVIEAVSARAGSVH